MPIQIREVWGSNLKDEIDLISGIVDEYPYVTLDTEFPGFVSPREGGNHDPKDLRYYMLRDNVNRLKVIQLGLTFSDKRGNLPRCGTDDNPSIWQFNFCEFDSEKDEHNESSIEMLKNHGIDLQKNKQEGATFSSFRELLMSSGALLNNTTWVAFNGGYEFGYLLRVLTGRELPNTRAEFFGWMNTYFTKVYDVKHMIETARGFCLNLEDEAGRLGVERVAGVSHQAGSDSLLTSYCFFELLRDAVYRDSLDGYAGFLCGLGNS